MGENICSTWGCGQNLGLLGVPAIISNDETLELHAVLAGKVLGQLAGVTAAPYIRAGKLLPILLDHMADNAGYFVYFGSRTSQLARARAFVDLAIKRLTSNSTYVLNDKDLRGRQPRKR